MFVIDDLVGSHPLSSIGTRWMLVTDTVMGGVSQGRLQREEIAGHPSLRMTGAVSLENDGGFIQMALDLAPEAEAFDASEFSGIEVDVCGNGEEYELRLRTTELTRSWQSYRQAFSAEQDWKTVRLPFSEFQAHRTETPLNLARLRRIGLIAIGRAFDADLAVGGVRFY